jgi:signal transduction histidine kinase
MNFDCQDQDDEQIDSAKIARPQNAPQTVTGEMDGSKSGPDSAPPCLTETEPLPHARFTSETAPANPLSPDAEFYRLRLIQRERQIAAMHQLSEALFSQSSVEAMLRETLKVSMETVGADAGSIQMYDPARDELVFRVVFGEAAGQLHNYSIPSNQGIAGRVFNSGVSDLTTDVSQHADFSPAVDEDSGFETRAMATVPIKRPVGSPIGVMQILNFEGLDQYLALEVLEVMAAQAAIAIENARLVRNGRKAAMVNLIGDISHDIKNMLTPIQTGAWTLDPMLRQMFDDLDFLGATFPPEFEAKIKKATLIAREDYEWILENMLGAAERVRLRTQEIADAVKGESAPPHFIEGDVNESCQEVVKALFLVAHDAQVELVPDFDPALPKVEFDHKQIYNALYNLVNNAIPETPEGGTVTIRTRVLGPSERNFLIEVADTGRGIPPHVRDRLFTDEAISTKPGGTGLGTRIVADIVRRHRGHIAVHSEVGQGTTFTLLLPLSQTN